MIIDPTFNIIAPSPLTASRLSKNPPRKQNGSPVVDERTADFVQEQRLNLSQVHEGSSGLLEVSGNGREHEDHSPIGAVLRRRAERREQRASQDNIGLGLDRDYTSRTPVEDNALSIFANAQYAQHPTDNSSALSFGERRARSLAQTSSLDLSSPISKAPRTNRSPLDNNAATISSKTPPRTILLKAISVHSSSPISYTPKGTPPRAAHQGTLRTSTRKEVAVPATATLDAPTNSRAHHHHSPVQASEMNVRDEPISVGGASQSLNPKTNQDSSKVLESSETAGSKSIFRQPPTESTSSSASLFARTRMKGESLSGKSHHSFIDNRGRRIRQSLRQQSKMGSDTGAYSEPRRIRSERDNRASDVLDVVEELRAETRGALIGLHMDLIKTGHAWKVRMVRLIAMPVFAEPTSHAERTRVSHEHLYW